MSCGCNCADLIPLLHELLDAEVDAARCAEIRARIAACPGCAERLGIEEELRALVRECCGCKPAPQQLKERIAISLKQVRITDNAGTRHISQQQVRIERQL